MLENRFSKDFDKWKIDLNVDDVYDIDFVGFTDEGFLVILKPDHFIEEKRSDHKLKLVWGSVISYTVTDESYRPELWGNENDKSDAYSFYISKNSDYLRKIKYKNYLVDERSIHFLIAGTNLNVDILSFENPDIEYLDI
ncbi:hypothetical protein [Helcococcus kunzii]|uniref:hypothetical protein n=1 Tax=Helcococcus kunzii TaxID=40091 RepID=UPI0024AD9451|nr:hypothetical protein [Helcococcus kunzii]